MLGSMILQLKKKKLFTRFNVIFSKILRLPIFFNRFLRKEQAHDSLGPWVTCRTTSLPFNSKHLRARFNDSGYYGLLEERSSHPESCQAF